MLPWHPDLWLDSEDALDLRGSARAAARGARRVAVVRLPRISNFTDVDALGLEPDLDVVFVSDPRALGDADLVVLPGTRATIADLAWLRARGLDRAVRRTRRRAGKPLLGHLRRVPDARPRDSRPGRGRGTRRRRSTASGCSTSRPASPRQGAAAAARNRPRRACVGIRDPPRPHHPGAGVGEFLGGARTGQVFGTMWHGSLEGDDLRAAFLRETLGLAPSGTSFPAARERRLDLLGELVEAHLDVDALLELARHGRPGDLPFLPPGAP